VLAPAKAVLDTAVEDIYSQDCVTSQPTYSLLILMEIYCYCWLLSRLMPENFRAFEEEVLRRVFGPKREEIIGD
jgi:hypothetical protein